MLCPAKIHTPIGGDPGGIAAYAHSSPAVFLTYVGNYARVLESVFDNVN